MVLAPMAVTKMEADVVHAILIQGFVVDAEDQGKHAGNRIFFTGLPSY